MTISENATQFYDLPVVDFEGESDWKGTDHAYRIRTDWDTPVEALGERLEMLASHADAGQLKALVLGNWGGDDSSNDSSEIVKQLAESASKLSGLRAIFLGDITYEENEMSWIQQSDISPLLSAYPQLEVLRIRGGSDLSITACNHANLKQLIIETGGMPRSVLREIFQGDLPGLEHLELWLGTDGYGWDGGPQDLQPLLTGKLYPNLHYLGLRNSEQIDEIAPILPNAPLVARIKVLDLSLGSLSDVGGRSLLALSGVTNLEKLNLSHHYMTPELVAELTEKLPFEVVTKDAMGADEEWRSIYVSE